MTYDQAPRNYAGFFPRFYGDFRQIMQETSQIIRQIAQYYAGLHNILQVLKLKTNVRNFPTESHKSDETCILFG